MNAAKLLVCGVLCFSAGAVCAQRPIVGTAKLAAATDVSGRWFGAFDIVRPDGSVDPDKTIFVLKQNGDVLTGTAGSSLQKMDAISDGHVDGADVRFVVTVHQNVPVHFALQHEADHLRGQASGLPGMDPGTKVLVDVVRWPQNAAAPEIVHAKDGLYATIAALDTKLFEAYNHCDLDTMSSLVADDLEFYHDKTGLSVGKQPFLDAIKNNICTSHTQRTLVPGSLDVYPLKGYGAVELGVHRFQHAGDPGTGEAKFVMVWQNKGGIWKITRVISYDHEPLKQ